MSGSRLYPERTYLAASVAVIRDGRVLLAARARPPLARLFSLPGGLVEPGESLAEAARRELREEVGIEAEILDVLRPVEIIERDEAGRTRAHFVVCPHLGRWLAGEAAPGEEAFAVTWATREEARRLEVTPGLPEVLDLAFNAAGKGR